MSAIEDLQPEDRKEGFSRAALITGGTVLLGVIGSGLWDVVAKPGLGWLGRATLSTLTLGSDYIRDTAYSTAALDPTPVASLLLIMLLVSAPLALGIGLLTATILRPWLRKHFGRHAKSETDAEALAKRRKKLRRTSVGIVLSVSLPAYVMVFLGAGVVNQAVIVWRVFHANVRIVDPYISSEEHDRLMASFAAMRTKADYLRIVDEMRRVAIQAGVELRPETTW